MKKKFFANLWLTFHSWSPSAYSISITPPTNRAKLEPFDKTNAGNPHKYRLSAFLSVIQTLPLYFIIIQQMLIFPAIQACPLRQMLRISHRFEIF